MPQLDLSVWPILVPYVVVGLFSVYAVLYVVVFNFLFSILKKNIFFQFYSSLKTLF